MAAALTSAATPCAMCTPLVACTGRHGLPHRQVARNQRTRLLSAPSRHRVYCSITACVKASNSRAAEGLTFRTGTASDERVMFQMIWAERMNPLGLRPERFTVATDSAGRLLGFGQLEQRDGYLELRSMIVVPAARRQGVGRALLQQLLQRAGDADILLTTISSRIGFYAAAGFRQLQRKEVPRSLLFEIIAGTVVARIAAAEELVVLKKEGRQQQTR